MIHYIAVALLLALSPHVARKRALGDSVTVEGWVGSNSGAFSSLMNGDNGFMLSSPATGIYVTTKSKAFYSVGTELEVKGILADDGHGLLTLRAYSIRRVKGRRLIKPDSMPLSHVSEATEGRLVCVEGEVARPLVSDLPYGHKLFLTRDGAELQIFLPAQVRPDAALLTPGRTLRITGFSWQYNKTYEVVPRSVRDIEAR